MNPKKDYYAVLGVDSHCDFPGLRRAYYCRAMDCHPDRFGGDLVKKRQFQGLVEAFQVLSDPVQRRRYDRSRWVAIPDADPLGKVVDRWLFPEEPGAILDTFADDILEELIVGNTIPTYTSLVTLMLDLERTQQFLFLREGKNYFYVGRIREAEAIFQKYLMGTPYNLLARYYLARCHQFLGNSRHAERELRRVIHYGLLRSPPLRLTRIRRELQVVQQVQRGLVSRIRNLISQPVPEPDESPGEAMRRVLGITITRILRDEQRNQQPCNQAEAP